MAASVASRLGADLVDLMLPRSCAGCSAPGAALCPACRGPGEPFPIVPAPIDADAPTFAAGVYDGGLRAAIVAYKERGRRDLSSVLAGLLARSVQAVGSAISGDPLVLVAVPSSRAAARARGGAHLPRLARRAARISATTSAQRVLWLGRAVQDSVGLTVADRIENVRGAMVASAAPAGGIAVIVDDIVTTGATLGEAARALRAAGWPVAGAAVIAATLRHDAVHPVVLPGYALDTPGNLRDRLACRPAPV